MVLWVKTFQTEITIKSIPKSIIRAIGKVLLMTVS